ncbi:TPA_asm: L [Pinellia alphacytorhabdovirus 1]|nr:TPA_asm: L [Pinellia alphacytorhabdovirus 1]
MDHNSMDTGYDSDSEPSQQYDSLPDYHLRNPLKCIKGDVIDFCDRGKEKTGSLRFRQSIKKLKYYGNKIIVGEHTDLITKPDQLLMTSDLRTFGLCLGDVLDRLEMDQALSEYYDVTGMIESTKFLATQVSHEVVIRMRNMQDILLIMNALSSRRPVPERFSPLVRGGVYACKAATQDLLITGSHLGIVNGETSEITIYDSDWVRCASDVATERFLLHISSTMGNKKNSHHYPPWDLISEIISWGDSVLMSYGNNGYKLLKIYEALCTGYLMSQGNDEVIDNELFFKNTLRDAVIENEDWTSYLIILKNIFAKCKEIHWISQIYGLHRIWGHPLTFAHLGMEKVIKIGQKDICLSDRAPRQIGNHFKFLFVQGFFKKYKRYPLMEVSGNQDDLKEAYETNDPKLVDGTSFPTSIWEDVILHQNFQLPETFNLSMVVADKSVSPSRSELAQNILKRRTVMNADLRRGVLRWLNDESVDPRDLLRDINQGNFPEDQKIIGLTPKERELNPVPRMFALMSHVMRVYVVVTESMLSEHILPIFPQVTMTDNLLDLSKKIYSNSKGQTVNDKRGNKVARKTICMSLDFEKWNGHMRKSSTFHVFKALGELFGMENLFNATYDIFEGSFIYLADGSYVPEIDRRGFILNPPYSFTGHKGGMEGLRQKGWTIFTVVGLDFICRRHNCQYSIMGMGDNQVLMLTYFTYKVDGTNRITEEGKREIKKKHESLFLDLIDLFSELGLPLKPLETWSSECLFLYGKYPVWKGMPLTMDLKRLMRVFPFSNMETMTVENILNTVAGSATAAAQSAPSVFLSYIVGLIMLFMASRDLVIYHPLTATNLTGKYKSISSGKPESFVQWSLKTSKGARVSYEITRRILSNSQLSRLMCTVPRTIGGYVTFNLPTLAMRGFPDPLTKDLMTVRNWAVRSTVGSLKGLLKNWSEIIFMPDRNYSMLIEDILSVNHLNPVTPMSSVRQSVNEFLSDGSRIRNAEFRDLMRVGNRKNKETIAEYLCKGEELHIRLLHDIYSSTIMGYSDSIISKVTKTSTLQKLAISKASQDVTKKMSLIEFNYIWYFIWRSSVRGASWSSECSAEYAKDVRYIGWGKLLRGVTIAHPMEYMEKASCYDRDRNACSCQEGYVSVHLSDMVSGTEDWDRSIGASLPYLGSMTREKVTVQSGAKIYSSEPLVRRPISLLRTVNWFVPAASNTAEVIKSCLRAVTDIDPEEFVGVSEGTSGAEAHRYKDMSLSHGALTMSNYLYSTRFHLSTDNFFKYSKGGDNYDLHFQSLLCAVTEATNQTVFARSGNECWIPRCTHWKQRCSTCVCLLDESFTDIPGREASALIPSRKSNKYLYVNKERVSYIEDIRPFAHLMDKIESPSAYNNRSDGYKYDLMIDMMADFIASSLLSGEGSTADNERVDLHGGDVLNRVSYLKIRPTDLLETVADRIIQSSLWGAEAEIGESVERSSNHDKAKEAVAKAYPGCFLGIGLLYSWIETKSQCKPPMFARLDEDPPSTVGACNAAKYSLLNLISRVYQRKSRKTHEIIEELKDYGFSYKAIIVSKIEDIKGHCVYCLSTVRQLDIRKFRQMSAGLSCKKGHIIVERYPVTCQVLRVSMDRLRKDARNSNESLRCKASMTVSLRSSLDMNYNTSSYLFKYEDQKNMFEVRSREEVRRTEMNMRSLKAMKPTFNTTDVTRVLTKPTSALYKYSEIMSLCKSAMSGSRAVLVIGDGSGYTSDLISSMFGSKVIVSTLLNSETVIPQTMPHLFETADNDKVDKVTMINKVNNILHNNWHMDWSETAAKTDVLVSDIELLGVDRGHERTLALIKMLRVSSWKLAIVKDYIYSYSELCDRFSVIANVSNHFDLVSCQHRQKSRPELWWVIKNSDAKRCWSSADTPIDEGLLLLHDRAMEDIWRRIITWFDYQDNTCHFTTIEIEKSWRLNGAEITMITRAKLFCDLPTVGSLFPEGRDYTNVLGRLQRGNKPALVGYSRNDSRMRLYDSDREKIRERLLVLAISMLARPEHRAQLLNESGKWSVEWYKSRKLLSWMPYLQRCKTGTPYRNVSSEYIGVLNRLFNGKHMLFNSYGSKIEFKYDRKNKVKKLMFPVAKNMIIRLPSK